METEDRDLTEGGAPSTLPQVISVGLIITLDQVLKGCVTHAVWERRRKSQWFCAMTLIRSKCFIWGNCVNRD